VGNKKPKKKNKQNMQYVKTIKTPTRLEMAKIFNIDFKDFDKTLQELIDVGLIEVDGDVTHIYMPVSKDKKQKMVLIGLPPTDSKKQT